MDHYDQPSERPFSRVLFSQQVEADVGGAPVGKLQPSKKVAPAKKQMEQKLRMLYSGLLHGPVATNGITSSETPVCLPQS